MCLLLRGYVSCVHKGLCLVFIFLCSLGVICLGFIRGYVSWIHKGLCVLDS